MHKRSPFEHTPANDVAHTVEVVKKSSSNVNIILLIFVFIIGNCKWKIGKLVVVSDMRREINAPASLGPVL